MARHPDASKERRWLELILLCQKSKLTIHEFCERRRLSEPAFYFWKRVLRQRGLLQDPKHLDPAMASAAPKQPTFVELALHADAEAVTVVPIEIVLNARRFLRVRPGFDPDLLLQLVRLLEEPPC